MDPSPPNSPKRRLVDNDGDSRPEVPPFRKYSSEKNQDGDLENPIDEENPTRTEMMRRVSSAPCKDDEPPMLPLSRNVTSPGAFRVGGRSGGFGLQEADSGIQSAEAGETQNSPPVRERIQSNDESSGVLIEATLVLADAQDIEISSRPESFRSITETNETLTSTSIKIDLVEAKPVKRKRMRRLCCVLIMCTLIAAGIGVGAAVGIKLASRKVIDGPVEEWFPQEPVTANSSQTPVTTSSPDSPTHSVSPIIETSTRVTSTRMPTIAPTRAPTTRSPTTTEPTTNAPTSLNFFDEILPADTRGKIIADSSSPQAQAYNWLGRDPDYYEYSNFRRLQRFALAVVYFALDGRNWIKADNWISYGVHECDWYSDEITGDICDGDVFKVLYLYGTKLSGTIPKELFLLTSLVKLDLSENSITGPMPTQVSYLSDLRELDFHRNQLRGSIPSEIATLEDLTYFDISNNMLIQKVPTEISALTNLRVVNLASNRLSGAIPAQAFSTMRKLNSLSFASNTFSGALPTQIGLLSSVMSLDFSDNYLEGTVPTEFGRLTSATELFLQENNLSGSIPSELGMLTKLETLWLYSKITLNTFTNLPNLPIKGPVPGEVCDLFAYGNLQDFTVNCAFVQCFCGCSCQLF